MQHPPTGDPTQVRRDFARQLETFNWQISEAILALAVAAMLSHAWVGIEIKSVKFTIIIDKDVPPTRAQMIQRGDRLSRRRPEKTEISVEHNGAIVMAGFQQAERAGWCTIEQGYVYPTQKFASFMTAS